MECFEKLGIIAPILKAIEDEKFEKPSEIQEKAIPPVVEGKDVIAGAATGSGKTLVFGAGLIKDAEKNRGIQGLVLTPTRELAEQVANALKKFSKYKPLAIVAVYGGVSINPQIRGLQTADIVVGTPGRILDHIRRKTIKLGNVKILVLDEADRMLDMGFIDDVASIIKECPRQRQTLLFSATISSDVAYLSRKYMKNPVEISAEPYVDPTKLKQVYYDVDDNMKFSLLVHLLKNEHSGLVMVFCNTRRSTDFVAKNLKLAKINAQAIHGGFSQEKRNKAMRSFHSKNVVVLVCTDVAARGLDIPGVSHIYNYEIPKDSKQYIHRIGRTARAGNDGNAISLLSNKDWENFTRVRAENGVNITNEKRPYVEMVKLEYDERPRRFENNPRRRHSYGNKNQRRRH